MDGSRVAAGEEKALLFLPCSAMTLAPRRSQQTSPSAEDFNDTPPVCVRARAQARLFMDFHCNVR